jgi:hypothetical protein
MTTGSEVLAPNEKRTFYFPLIADFFVLNEIFLQGIDSAIEYKFKFSSSIWNGLCPDLTKFDLIVRHQAFDRGDTEIMEHRYANLNQEFLFRDLQMQDFDRTLNPGTNYEFILQSFNFQASELYVQIFKPNDMLGDFSQHIDSYDVSNTGNVSVIGTEAVEVSYQKFILNPVHDVANVLSADQIDPWVVIPFSSDLAADYANGEVNGFHRMLITDKLKIKTNSALTSEAYKIRVYAAKITTIYIYQGKILLAPPV